MRVPYKWLLEFISIDDEPERVAELLTSKGIETEYVFDIGEKLEGVVVGEIIKVMNHPNASNLKLCLVSDGKNINTVVCGAPNVKKGIKVAYAKPGAKIHGGIEIGKKNIRGQVSTGMLLSERELGWGSSHDGIYVFSENTPLGIDVNELKKEGDKILEIEITANRPDLLSIYGVAREVSLLKGVNIREWQVEEYQRFEGEKTINVILEENSCIFYSGRIIENVKVLPSPSWMIEKLLLCGINSINNVVDITNYVLCSYGQPLHAFDLDKIEGDIFVRSAKEGEEVVLLDGKNYRMKGGEIVIADSKKILALAGVMGAENSKVTEETKNIFLESAYFYPEKVRYASKIHSIMTDSSYRFERGVDPEGVLKGLEEASCMISRICSGKVNKNRIERGSLKKEERFVEITEDIVENIIGVKIEKNEIKDVLSKIGRIEERGEKIIFFPPSFRKDLNIKESVAGEIGRVYGFDKIPSKIPPITWVPKRKNEREILYRRIRNKLTGFGFFEVLNYPLVSSDIAGRFYQEKLLRIENPLVKPQDSLAPTLLFGMLKSLKFNISRGEKNIFLFEFGKVFTPEERMAIG
ncbi:MAG: phenylalanine--tRNA ligase subunit beta, partial [Caldiserica bacterium]